MTLGLWSFKWSPYNVWPGPATTLANQPSRRNNRSRAQPNQCAQRLSVVCVSYSLRISSETYICGWLVEWVRTNNNAAVSFLFDFLPCESSWYFKHARTSCGIVPRLTPITPAYKPSLRCWLCLSGACRLGYWWVQTSIHQLSLGITF